MRAQDLCGKAEGADLFDPRLKVGDARTDADEVVTWSAALPVTSASE
jgi:hypothetical protein